MEYKDLSTEQQTFVRTALAGHNILVDACIGSGKTTAIQSLCSMYDRNVRILYLTYNKLLKLDAVSKIHMPNVTVTNYHGFASGQLRRIGVVTSVSDMIQAYNREKPPVPEYRVLILDEYQDVEQELADMLWHIKDSCPGIQLIAVGDMAQKIYDKTRLDVSSFISEFLGSFISMEFTKCFRISGDHATMLGRIWGKTITGVNDDCQVMTMGSGEAREFALSLEPSSLLVLGMNGGQRSHLQNFLEKEKPDVFNHNTVWSKLTDSGSGGVTSPDPKCAIFTTYDGCKGMERDVCFLYDWTVKYWETRLQKPSARYEIIRNIFCVAASRGKRMIIFVEPEDDKKRRVSDGDGEMLDEEHLSGGGDIRMDFQDMQMSGMFDFKFIEDVEAAYHCLSIKEISPAEMVIPVDLSYGMVDLSSCVNTYTKCCYFSGYSIDSEIIMWMNEKGRSSMYTSLMKWQEWSLPQKIQFLTMLETMQRRYFTSVPYPIVPKEHEDAIVERMQRYVPDSASVQLFLMMPVWKNGRSRFTIKGVCDAVHEGELWQFHFVSELAHTNCLHVAMLLAASGYQYGHLVNVRTGQHLRISIPDTQAFLDKALYAATKGGFSVYEYDHEDYMRMFVRLHSDVCDAFIRQYRDGRPRGDKFVREFMEEHKLQLLVRGSEFADFLLSSDLYGIPDNGGMDVMSVIQADDRSYVQVVVADMSLPDISVSDTVSAPKKQTGGSGSGSSDAKPFTMRQKLQDAVLDGSESDDLLEAVKEWRICEAYLDQDGTTTCICGQSGIKYVYGIVNKKTGVRLFPLGSECIRKFGMGGLSEYVSCFEGIMKIAVAMKEGLFEDMRGRLWGELDICDSSYFTKKMFRFLYKEGCFEPSDYNHQDGENDMIFCMDMLYARSHHKQLTELQKAKCAVMSRQVGQFILMQYAPLIKSR